MVLGALARPPVVAVAGLGRSLVEVVDGLVLLAGEGHVQVLGQVVA